MSLRTITFDSTSSESESELNPEPEPGEEVTLKQPVVQESSSDEEEIVILRPVKKPLKKPQRKPTRTPVVKPITEPVTEPPVEPVTEPVEATESQKIQEAEERVTYKLERSSSLSLHGKTEHFQLFHNTEPLYHCKVNLLKNSHMMAVCDGSEVHMKDRNGYRAVIVSDNNNETFSLRNQTEIGDEMMTIRFFRPESKIVSPRMAKVYFFAPNDGYPQKMVSKKPRLLPGGVWSLSFGKKFAQASIKNSILVDPDSGTEYVTCRKMEKNVLFLEAPPSMDPLYALAFGISSFTCKL